MSSSVDGSSLDVVPLSKLKSSYMLIIPKLNDKIDKEEKKYGKDRLDIKCYSVIVKYDKPWTHIYRILFLEIAIISS